MAVSDRPEVIRAIRASWSRETSADPDHWTVENPAKGHCDVSSFVAWEQLGGDLVLAQAFANGELQEHHYWNRIAGEDLDLTREQFEDDVEVREIGLGPG